MTDDTERRNAILSDLDPHEALRMVLQREAETAERRDAREDALRACAEAAEAERDKLREVLDVDPWKVGFAHWKDLRARAALTDTQEGQP